MDRVVVAVLLLALTIGMGVAAYAVMNKQMTVQQTIYKLDATGSYIALDTTTGGGNATVALVLRNTGTAVAYIQRIIIVQSKIEVDFVNGQAWMTAWGAPGLPSQGAVTNSSAKVHIDANWLVLPAKETIQITFVHGAMNTLIDAGNRYLVTVYPYGSGKIDSFYLTVQST